MKTYRMKFDYWDDAHTKLLRAERGPGSGHPEEDARWADDPEWYCRQHFRHGKDGAGPYFLNKRCHGLLLKHGPFKGRYRDGEVLVGVGIYDACFIVCPGPSLSEVDLSEAQRRLPVIAVNSAGFLVRPNLWVMAESGYAKWLVARDPTVWGHLCDVNVAATARVAVVLRAHELSVRERGGELMRACYVIRWEERFVVPPRTPAVSITNALVTAWQMGFKQVYVLGMDLSKEGGPYVKGVPHTKEGAANPFDDQIKALSQFELPDFEVINCSPLSKDTLPFRYVPYSEALSVVDPRSDDEPRS